MSVSRYRLRAFVFFYHFFFYISGCKWSRWERRMGPLPNISLIKSKLPPPPPHPHPLSLFRSPFFFFFKCNFFFLLYGWKAGWGTLCPPQTTLLTSRYHESHVQFLLCNVLNNQQTRRVQEGIFTCWVRSKIGLSLFHFISDPENVYRVNVLRQKRAGRVCCTFTFVRLLLTYGWKVVSSS